MSSGTFRHCLSCAGPIPRGFPEGMCPRCLLERAVRPELGVRTASPSGQEAPPGARPGLPPRVPTLEALRDLFPDLEILDLLGAGGMGAVYKARQPRLNRLVALKIMFASSGQETDFALRFEREAQVLARLNHPYIVTIYDFGDLGPERTGGAPLCWFLMEYVDGTDLGALIRSKELIPAKALAIVPQICDALQYAHDQGIAHRDIKPANILLDRDSRVKIADFGLAKMIGGAEDAMMTGLTRTGATMGTPHYMAPEQWEHPEQADHRVDIYALGVVFYEMLTGERPAGVFEPPSCKAKEVDRKLDGVVLRAMEKEPGRRYQQAAEVKVELTRISGASHGKGRPVPGASDGAKLGPGRKWFALAAVAGLALALLALALRQADVAPAAARPAPDWIRLDSQAVGQGEAKAGPLGWLLLARHAPQGGRIAFPDCIARNAGLRGRFHGADFKDLRAPYLMLRASQEKGIRSGIQLRLGEENGRPTVWIKRFSKADAEGTDLLKRPLVAPIPPDREYTLELYLIGLQAVARCNQEVFQVTLDHGSADPGRMALIEHLGPDRFRDVEFINFDGLSEMEALKLARME